MEKLRYGVIGIGNMGSGHCRSIVEGKCPEIALTAVADIDPARLEWARENLPEGVKLFTTAQALMESGEVDAVHIAVPHYDHPSLAIEALRRGLHVMVEKPAGVYTRQVREMNAEAVRHPELKFGMMFNQRTDHVYRKMRELTQGGTLGALRRSNWIITNWYRPQAYYDSGAWRATWRGEGGGVLLNQCPHNLDLWQWICGMPVKVQAHLHYGKWHDIEVEDDVTAYVEYENGATGCFITTTGDAPGTNRFEVTLEKGKLVSEDGVLKLWELSQREPEFSRENKIPFGTPDVVCSQVETDGESTQHVGILNAFAASVLHGAPLIARGEEGIRGLTLSNAMHLSDWTHSAVALPLDEDLYYEKLMERVKTSRHKEHVETVVSELSGTYGVEK